mmetsp:Transcript_45794/g.139124  ORF Transcript_45794/g.139124 Transcript_45794/m.139124 type:complete len:270 (+) Transcript_45794:415-1224(+)
MSPGCSPQLGHPVSPRWRQFLMRHIPLAGIYIAWALVWVRMDPVLHGETSLAGEPYLVVYLGLLVRTVRCWGEVLQRRGRARPVVAPALATVGPPEHNVHLLVEHVLHSGEEIQRRYQLPDVLAVCRPNVPRAVQKRLRGEAGTAHVTHVAGGALARVAERRLGRHLALDGVLRGGMERPLVVKVGNPDGGIVPPRLRRRLAPRKVPAVLVHPLERLVLVPLLLRPQLRALPPPVCSAHGLELDRSGQIPGQRVVYRQIPRARRGVDLI